MVTLVEQSRKKLAGPEAVAWLDRLEREHDNLRAALGWTRDSGEAELGLHLAGILGRFRKVRGHFREGRAWVQELLALEAGQADAALARPGLAEVRARALLHRGALAVEEGDYATAETWTDQARALAQAEALLREARALYGELGNPSWCAMVLESLAENRARRTEGTEARQPTRAIAPVGPESCMIFWILAMLSTVATA